MMSAKSCSDMPFSKPFGMAESALRDAGVPVEAVSRSGLGHGIDEDGIARAAAALTAAFGGS